MNRTYFRGALAQLEERTLQLLTRIPANAAEMELLEQNCRRELKEHLKLCKELRNEPVYQSPEVQGERLDLYRGLVESLDVLETVAVAALVRANDDDRRMNLLMREIVRETKFPLSRPTVSCTSRNYFHVYPHLNLVFVPLMESQQLLHLPDLYHELGHLTLAEEHDRRVLPFKEALKETKARVHGELGVLGARGGLGRMPARLGEEVRLWQYCWRNDWGVEFFCDLFAVFAVGPAFVWSHVHLCAKRRTALFALPGLDGLSHPADAARFQVMLAALRASGFTVDADQISASWDQLIGLTKESLSDEFSLCYPPATLSWMADVARAAYLKMGCHCVTPTAPTAVQQVLGNAWTEFWNNSAAYVAWEVAAANKLFLR